MTAPRSKDQLRKDRREATPIVLYLQPDDASEDWIDFQQATDQLRPLLLNRQASTAVMALLEGFCRTSAPAWAQPLDDAAASIVQQFSWQREDLQALATPFLEGLISFGERHYNHEHPELEPFAGLNERMTPSGDFDQGPDLRNKIR